MKQNQRNETDLQAVKELAKSMLYLEPEPVEMLPIFVRHPFSSSGIIGLREADGTIRMGNIMESKADKAQWRKQMTDIIDQCEDAMRVYHLVEKQYVLAFFKYAAQSLSQEDYAKMLADAWIRSENPNQDPNLSSRKLLSMFQKADPHHLLDSEEQSKLAQLDDVVTVYRGVRSTSPGCVKALSWTLDRKTAEWFANRYGRQGQVYEAKIQKDHIHALFHGRGESEVIVDPQYLMEVAQPQRLSKEPSMEVSGM